MWKTLLIIIIFILFAILTAFVFTIFFSPQEKLRYQECVLLQDPKTGQIDCFGCSNDICKDAPATWLPYQAREMGIPYACFESEQGCQLAQ